jgi:hypothetical protein
MAFFLLLQGPHFSPARGDIRARARRVRLGRKGGGAGQEDFHGGRKLLPRAEAEKGSPTIALSRGLVGPKALAKADGQERWNKKGFISTVCRRGLQADIPGQGWGKAGEKNQEGATQ